VTVAYLVAKVAAVADYPVTVTTTLQTQTEVDAALDPYTVTPCRFIPICTGLSVRSWIWQWYALLHFSDRHVNQMTSSKQ
jgi:hypothetical protein